jgi:geranylgeranyl diphosphate synthase type II
LRAAAVLAGAPHDVEDQLTEIGAHLGLAYQLQDDLLSVFGDPAAHGKDAFSDLREGKETAIIAYARMTSHWPSIELRFGSDDLDPADAADMRDLLSECGAEGFVRGLVEEQLGAATALLAEAEEGGRLSADAGRIILALADRIDGRAR